MVFELTIITNDGTSVRLEVVRWSNYARISIGPYNTTLTLRELRAFEVAVNMAIDAIEREFKQKEKA